MISSKSVVCVVCFLPICSGRQVRWTYQPGHAGGRSHRISHPQDFCGAWLHFSREKGFNHSFPSSAVKSNFVY